MYGLVCVNLLFMSFVPLLPTRFSREIPHFSICLICFSSKYSGGWGSLVWKLSLCKFTWSLYVEPCLWKIYFKETALLMHIVCGSFSNYMWMMQNALLVYFCEMVIDIIKHSFIAKFNDIKPIAYSEFLEDLCKQVYIFGYFLIPFDKWILLDTLNIWLSGEVMHRLGWRIPFVLVSLCVSTQVVCYHFSEPKIYVDPYLFHIYSHYNLYHFSFSGQSVLWLSDLSFSFYPLRL